MWPPPPSLSAIMRTEEGKGERGEREREAVGPTNREQRENAVINRLRDVFARAHTKEAANVRLNPNEGNMQWKRRNQRKKLILVSRVNEMNDSATGELDPSWHACFARGHARLFVRA